MEFDALADDDWWLQMSKMRSFEENVVDRSREMVCHEWLQLFLAGDRGVARQRERTGDGIDQGTCYWCQIGILELIKYIFRLKIFFMWYWFGFELKNSVEKLKWITYEGRSWTNRWFFTWNAYESKLIRFYNKLTCIWVFHIVFMWNLDKVKMKICVSWSERGFFFGKFDFSPEPRLRVLTRSFPQNKHFDIV